MRSLALTVLLGSFALSGSLLAQSLTEHAAAAAGATVGTAAGKPLGTALGGIFGNVDKTASGAASQKTAATQKPIVVKPTPVGAAPVVSGPAPVAAPPRGGGGEIGGGGDGAGGSGGSGATAGLGRSFRRSSRRKPVTAQAQVAAAAPIEPIAVQPEVKEPTAADIAKIQVGATAGELHASLGTPESTVSIPDDDGHLVEICQYWAKGEPVGTIRLDNGRVVSVRTGN
jgi:hypothetical protein